jgi:hypothetical protein
MNKLIMTYSLALSLLILTLLCGTVTPGLAQGMDPKVEAEIRGTLQKHDKALTDQDLATVMGTYAPGPNTVLMGTGPGERWVGKEEIEDAYKHFFQDYDKGTLITECYWNSSGSNGTMAWVMAMCKFTDSLKDKKREYGINLSVALEMLEGKWYIRTFHFSNLTGGQPPQ